MNNWMDKQLLCQSGFTLYYRDLEALSAFEATIRVY